MLKQKHTLYKEYPLEAKTIPSFESDSFSLLELSDEEDSATPLEDTISKKEHNNDISGESIT